MNQEIEGHISIRKDKCALGLALQRKSHQGNITNNLYANEHENTQETDKF